MLTPMYSSIVVGTDGSPTARGAVRRATDLAKMCGAKLCVVSAYNESNMAAASALSGVATPTSSAEVRAQVEGMLQELADEIRQAGVEAETIAYPGNAAQSLLDVAEGQGCDLIVVGNRGMQGARRVLGSVPNKVSHQADCSVLIVRTS